MGMIIKTPMQPDVSSWLGWAGCLGVITHRNDVVKSSSLKFRNVLRLLVRNIDSHLLHHFNGLRVHPDRIGSSTQSIKPIAR
jgi:hypothetical protein